MIRLLPPTDESPDAGEDENTEVVDPEPVEDPTPIVVDDTVYNG